MKPIFWVLRPGAPWKDTPRNKEFSHPSTAHAWLGRMQGAGFLEELLKLAEQLGCIDAQRQMVFFPADAEEESRLIMGTKGKV